MGTRSRIGIENEDGTVTSIYCHWDGYVSHNGKILAEHYVEDQKVRALIALGDISSLGRFVAPAEGEAHSFERNAEDVTVAYNRDRGESDVDARTDANRAEFVVNDYEEYGYIFKDGAWEVISAHDRLGFRPLTEALASKDHA